MPHVFTRVMTPGLTMVLLSILHLGCLDFQASTIECDGANIGDGVDNDGDGAIDEGCSCQYDDRTHGVCGDATYDAGGVAMCSLPRHFYAVEVTRCDGYDNDCDGLVDEGCRCGFGDNEVGVCALGRVDEAGMCPKPALHEAMEVGCDGYDNDCDGITDEGCPQCDYQGNVTGVCAYGSPRQDGTCSPPLNWSDDERDCRVDPLGADGVDNDCDGFIDEGCACAFMESVIGVCANGRRSTQGCLEPARYQADESLCDGEDNDCDGLIDEGCAPEDVIIPDDPAPSDMPRFTSTPPLSASENTRLSYEVACEAAGAPEPSISTGEQDTCGGTIEGSTYVADFDETRGGSTCTLDVRCSAGNASINQVSMLDISEDQRPPSFVDFPTMPIMRPRRQTHTLPLDAQDEDLPAQQLTVSITQNTCSRATEFVAQIDALQIVCGEVSEQCTVALSLSDQISSTPWNLDVHCTNDAPSAMNVAITRGDSELICTYDFLDADGDADMSRIAWFANGALLPETSPTLQSYDAGDTLRCEVTPFDGETEGAVQSAEFTVAASPQVEGLASGENHVCAIRQGRLFCWGRNTYGQTGEAASSMPSSPVTPAGMDAGVTHVTAGGDSTCAIQQGALYCWGRNLRGELGTGDRLGRDTPSPVQGMSSGVTDVATSGTHTCAIQQDVLYCWGENSWGQLGIGRQGDARTSPQPIAPPLGLSIPRQVAVGDAHTCAVWDLTLYCWGQNTEGQLGRPYNVGEDSTFPVIVPGFTMSLTESAAGARFTCAARGGALSCWGNNQSYQCAQGNTMSPLSIPQDVTTLDADVTHISASAGFACAIKQGQVWCWGDNVQGRLGNMTNSRDNPTPEQVSGLIGVTDIATGAEHACAITSQEVYCWGSNGWDVFGVNNSPMSNTPYLITLPEP